jgi:hypothetical protein
MKKHLIIIITTISTITTNIFLEGMINPITLTKKIYYPFDD